MQDEIDVYFSTDVDVVCAETGKRICAFRKNMVSEAVRQDLQAIFEPIARKQQNLRRITNEGEGASGMIAGYIDRRDVKTTALIRSRLKKPPTSLGIYACRQTVFTAKNPDGGWDRAVPVLRAIAEVHRATDPEAYARQEAYLTEHIAPELRISGTAYTTVSINRSMQTRIHCDAGDYKDGSGMLVVAGHSFEGGQLCFPRYGIALCTEPGDFVAMDVHEWHGNLPIVHTRDDGFRLSLIAYVREGMAKCKRRVPGEKLLMTPADWKFTHGDMFDNHLADLQAFVRDHGRLPKITEPPLGDWCHNRRTDRRDRKLPKERARALEKVPGWSWTTDDHRDMREAHIKLAERHAAAFQANLANLQAYIDAHGALPTKAGEAAALRKWVDNRVQDIRKQRMLPERQAAFERVIEKVPTASSSSSNDAALPPSCDASPPTAGALPPALE